MACRVDWVIEVIVVSAEHKRDPLTKLTFFVDFWLRKPKPVVVFSIKSFIRNCGRDASLINNYFYCCRWIDLFDHIGLIE